MTTALEITGYGSPDLSLSENRAIFQKWVDITRENADMEARLWVSAERGIRSIEAATGVAYLPPIIDVIKPKPVRSEASVREVTPRSKRHEQDVAALRRQIDVKVVAEALHCTPKHIYDLAKSGELTYSRDGRNITFELADVQAYQASIRIVATR